MQVSKANYLSQLECSSQTSLKKKQLVNQRCWCLPRLPRINHALACAVDHQNQPYRVTFHSYVILGRSTSTRRLPETDLDLVRFPQAPTSTASCSWSPRPWWRPSWSSTTITDWRTPTKCPTGWVISNRGRPYVPISNLGSLASLKFCRLSSRRSMSLHGETYIFNGLGLFDLNGPRNIFNMSLISHTKNTAFPQWSNLLLLRHCVLGTLQASKNLDNSLVNGYSNQMKTFCTAQLRLPIQRADKIHSLHRK